MILYSVTVNIEESIHDEWLKWMKEEHIPEVMKTNCFLSNKIMRLREPVQEGITYSFQYFCESEEKLSDYRTNHAPKLQAVHASRYPNKFVIFNTILEVI